jgi:hypothetical protein
MFSMKFYQSQPTGSRLMNWHSINIPLLIYLGNRRLRLTERRVGYKIGLSFFHTFFVRNMFSLWYCQDVSREARRSLSKVSIVIFRILTKIENVDNFNNNNNNKCWSHFIFLDSITVIIFGDDYKLWKLWSDFSTGKLLSPVKFMLILVLGPWKWTFRLREQPEV